MNTVNLEEQITVMKNGSVLSPKGFLVDGIHAGLRYAKLDVGLIYSIVPATSTAVYTQSLYQAAPLIVTKNSLLTEGLLQAVIVNSACANACTGQQGLTDAYTMRQWTAEKLNLPDHYVAVASTGVIGEFLQMRKIELGIKQLMPSESFEAADKFENAILTTDSVTKNCGFQTEIDGLIVKMGGASKGSGMIHPNMATMLGFITTDANVEKETLEKALSQVTDLTFNQITIDGDTSTNDMVLVMANGLAGNEQLTEQHPQWPQFLELLKQTCEKLAKEIARDGEGATKLVEVTVKGTRSDEDARKIAKTIIGSNLVKTAIYGADANWGRIIAAMGRSDVECTPEQTSIWFGPILVLDHGVPVPFDEEKTKEYLLENEIYIYVQLVEGKGKGKAWGCDLTYEYVKINASYRT